MDIKDSRGQGFKPAYRQAGIQVLFNILSLEPYLSFDINLPFGFYLI
jgi:hypothetical protein